MKKRNREITLKYGCQSETGQIKSIILKHPKDALGDQEYINANWKDLHFNGWPDYEKNIELIPKLIKANLEQIPKLSSKEELISFWKERIVPWKSI